MHFYALSHLTFWYFCVKYVKPIIIIIKSIFYI